jgi:hypothetical protein
MRILVITLAFMSVAFTGLGQKKGTPEKPSNDMDLKYSPPSTSIFNSKSASNSSSQGTVTTVLDFNVSLLGRGVVGFGGERQIGKSALSINAGLGYVFNKDFVQMMMASPDGADLLSSPPNSDIDFGQLLKYGTFSTKKRFYGSLGLRIYSDYSGDLDGKYFELGARWHNYAVKVDDFSDNNSGYEYVVSSPIINQIKNVNYCILYGYQGYGYSGKVYNNVYWGVGFNKVQFDGMTATDISANNGFSNQTYRLSLNGKTASGFVPCLIFGWEIGFGL